MTSLYRAQARLLKRRAGHQDWFDRHQNLTVALTFLLVCVAGCFN
jgi:hypothetical protein